jgi:hypothetical protein
VSGLALAQEGKNVTTGADSAKLGGEFRSELIYSDNGLEKMEGSDPEASTEIGVSTANIKLDGKVNPMTDYSFSFNLLDSSEKGPLKYGYGKHWFSKMIGFSIGRQKVLQGGFDNVEGNYRAHAVGIYICRTPLLQPSSSTVVVHRHRPAVHLLGCMFRRPARLHARVADIRVATAQRAGAHCRSAC